MVSLRRKHLAHLEKLGLITWLRYVDDIFATVNSQDKVTDILTYLNGQHPNIRFTVEHEKDRSLPFLDTTVYRGLTRFNTTIYRKKTFTGVYLNWTSLTSKRYKLGLIYCLLDRIWKICNEEKMRNAEIEKLRQILAKNDYPDFVVDREISKFIANRTTATEHVPTVEKSPRWIVLPYSSHKAEGFAKRLKELFTNNYWQVNFNVAFKTPSQVDRYFPFKDNVKNTLHRSMVVYKVKCGHIGCDASYIGKTMRTLALRMDEHRKTPHSACHQHESANPGHYMSYDEVEVIDSADSNQKLEIKELLHIISEKPSLNKQLNEQSKFNIKTLIIAAYQQVNGAGAP